MGLSGSPTGPQGATAPTSRTAGKAHAKIRPCSYATDLLNAVMDPTSNLWLVSGGLHSLRFMVELSPGLSAVTRESMTLAAERYLTEPGAGNYLVIVGAIDLAAVLSDLRLDEILRPLASDPAEVQARGVDLEGSNRIERIQRRAQRALERVPPLPRPR